MSLLEEGREVIDDFNPNKTKKTILAMKATRALKRITLLSQAMPGETLYVNVPVPKKDEVIIPGSLALRFDIDLSGGHANNFLVQNVSRELVSQMLVRFSNEVLQNLTSYNIYKTFTNLFLPVEKRERMIREGIQSEDLCKIRSNSGDKKTTGVDAEKKLNKVYGSKYCINLDNEILTHNGVFYPQALYNNLEFELTLAPVDQVVRGPDQTKLKYKLTNIQIEYEVLSNNMLADEVKSAYESKEFVYDQAVFIKGQTIKKDTDGEFNIKINTQRRPMKAILLLFVEPYTAGQRDSEKYVFPDLKEVTLTIGGTPNSLYNKIESEDLWREASRFFIQDNLKTQFMNPQKFYTDNKFGLIIDLRSMPSQEMHGSGTSLLNTTEGVQLEIKREVGGSGDLKCHVFVISDAQINIEKKQLHSVNY